MGERYQSDATGGAIHRVVSHPDGEMCGGVLFLHGWGDHLGTQTVPIKMLNDAGYLVLGIDWPGCGNSFGKRGHLPGGIATATALIQENLSHLTKLLSNLGTAKVGLYAHSTGGFFTLSYLAENPGPDLDWLWFSSPLLQADHGQPDWKKRGAEHVAKLFPGMTFDTGVRAKDTRNFTPVEYAEKVASGYYKRCHHKISAQLGYELMQRTPRIYDGAEAISDPTRFLLTVGSEDRVCPATFARELFERIPATDKTFALLEGQRHEPFNETDNSEFLEIGSKWLQA